MSSETTQIDLSEYLPDGATADEMVRLARHWQQEGRMLYARALYQFILKQWPGHVDALNFGGVVTFQIGDREEGVALVRESIARLPEYPDAHANLGLMLYTMNQLEEAHVHLSRAIELDPIAISPRLTFANLLRKQGKMGESLELLEKLREESPRDPLVLHSLSALLRALGKPERARAELQVASEFSNLDNFRVRIADMFARDGHFEQAQQQMLELLALEPDSAELKYQLAIYGGTPPPERTGDKLVSEIFDAFAPKFESKLAHLKYQGPEMVNGLLRRVLAPAALPVDMLDAGCGTGLLAPLVRDLARTLHGVDLSDGMLAKARERNLYDELVAGELTAYLDAHPARYDVIAIVDTFCYFGALDGATKAAFTCLRPGGWLIFSIEDGLDQPEEHRLHIGGRYAHRLDHVERSLQAAGFEPPLIDRGTLRTEMAQPVPGLICAARKGA